MAMAEGNRHYSNKGGHSYRGDFLKEQERMRKENGNPNMSLKAIFHVPGDVDWLRRGFMQRTPQDGRK